MTDPLTPQGERDLGTTCSHCSEKRVCRCTYSDCPWEVDNCGLTIDALRKQVEGLTQERDEARANEDDGLAWDALKLCRARAETAEAQIAQLTKERDEAHIAVNSQFEGNAKRVWKGMIDMAQKSKREAETALATERAANEGLRDLMTRINLVCIGGGFLPPETRIARIAAFAQEALSEAKKTAQDGPERLTLREASAGLREALAATVQPLEHAAHALDGVIALDEEDEGRDGGSATCQAVLRTINRALKTAREVLSASPTKTETGAEDWKDDPSADERWNAGLDYGQTQLCNVLGVDPATVSWDAATETLDGDVRSVIGNILTAHFGDEWRTPETPAEAYERGRADERERAAQVADGFTCGLCGMDGKAGAAIRKRGGGVDG